MNTHLWILLRTHLDWNKTNRKEHWTYRTVYLLTGKEYSIFKNIHVIWSKYRELLRVLSIFSIFFHPTISSQHTLTRMNMWFPNQSIFLSGFSPNEWSLPGIQLRQCSKRLLANNCHEAIMSDRRLSTKTKQKRNRNITK